MKTISIRNDRYVGQFGDHKFSSGKPAYVEYLYRKAFGQKLTIDEIMVESSGSPVDTNFPKKENVNMEFCINTRFNFLHDVVTMVASGIQASAMITGKGGIGKSHNVLSALKKAGYADLQDLEIGANPGKNTFIQIKGFSTAKNLFRTLYEYNNSVLVMDDIDSVLKDPIAVNILKAALDSYDKRVITWGSEMRGDDELPRSFVFTGRVIFISNLDQNKIDQAIRSRSMCIDLSMTLDQKLERMDALVEMEDFMEEYEYDHKIDAMSVIRQFKDSARDINLRTLISVTKIRSTDNPKWIDLAKYVLCN